MSTNALRGAVLVALAILLGAIVLGRGLDDPVPGFIESGASAVDAVDPNVDDGVEVFDTDTNTVPAVTFDDPLTTDETLVDDGLNPAPAEEVVQPPAPAPIESAPHDPSEVTVQVANAAGVNGLAGNFTDRLQARNYVTRTPANADPAAVSIVYYEPTYDGDARQIVTEVFNSPDVLLEPMPDPPPAITPADANGSNIIMIVGSDALSQS